MMWDSLYKLCLDATYNTELRTIRQSNRGYYMKLAQDEGEALLYFVSSCKYTDRSRCMSLVSLSVAEVHTVHEFCAH